MSLHYQYADMHCDTLLHGLGKGVNDIYDMPDAMLDIKRMAEANVLCQFFAVFFPPRPEMLNDYLQSMYRTIYVFAGIFNWIYLC